MVIAAIIVAGLVLAAFCQYFMYNRVKRINDNVLRMSQEQCQKEEILAYLHSEGYLGEKAQQFLDSITNNPVWRD